MKLFSLSMCVCVCFAACGGGDEASKQPARTPTAAVAALMLAKEPANGLAVVAAKQKGAADQVAVTGRVSAITPGFAQLKLMDLAVPYCGETNKEDKCKTPWDYCCESKDHQLANTLVVEARDAGGKTLATPSLGDLRLLDQVVVTGKMIADDHGNLLLVASGWFRKARPTLPDYVQLPQ